MSYQVALWVIFAAIVLFLSIAGKKLSKRVHSILIVIAIVVFLLPSYLPCQLFGSWNSISKLNGKTISAIHLQPSAPNWKVNLVGKNIVLSNQKQIDTIIQLLRNTNAYFPSHPQRVWETKMLLLSTTHDTFEIKIEKTDNGNGTIINTPTNRWRKDGIGSFLERVMNYHQPVYSDTATPEPFSID